MRAPRFLLWRRSTRRTRDRRLRARSFASRSATGHLGLRDELPGGRSPAGRPRRITLARWAAPVNVPSPDKNTHPTPHLSAFRFSRCDLALTPHWPGTDPAPEQRPNRRRPAIPARREATGPFGWTRRSRVTESEART